MKATTNQTRQFCNQNVYYRMFLDLHDETYYSNGLNVGVRFYCEKKRGVVVSYSYANGKYVNQIDLTTFVKNVSFRRVAKEFERRFDMEFNKSIHVQSEVCGLTFVSFFRMRDNGTWSMYVTGCNRRDDVSFYKLPFGIENEHVTYNGKLTTECMQSFLTKYVEKYIYPAGRFRDLQLSGYYSKDEIKRLYRRYIETVLHTVNIADLEYQTSKWLLRVFNIDIDNVDFDDAIRTAKRIGKQPKRIILEYFDNSFTNELDGDVDELESAFWCEMDNYPEGTYFIN